MTTHDGQQDASQQRRIQHTAPSFGPGAAPPPNAPSKAPHSARRSSEPEPLPVAEPVGPTGGSKTITAFDVSKRHEEEWNRTPNTTGAGAIHVKTFHAKLTDDALRYMDQCINEWLDAHPQYEVKFVNSAVGTLTGKTKEPHLICQVWV